MKRCSTCKLELPYDQFSKKTSTKDGLQCHCKSCSKKASKKFRELNQDYYWGEDGYFRLHRKELTSYMIKYQKSDKTIKIYCIKTPEGYYIGATKTNLPVRLKEHIKDYKDYTKGCKKKLPLLYDSLDKYPFEESYNMIKNAYVIKEVQGTHKEKFQLETEYIHQFIMEGKKLLNKLKANLEISK